MSPLQLELTAAAERTAVVNNLLIDAAGRAQTLLAVDTAHRPQRQFEADVAYIFLIITGPDNVLAWLQTLHVLLGFLVVHLVAPTHSCPNILPI